MFTGATRVIWTVGWSRIEYQAQIGFYHRHVLWRSGLGCGELTLSRAIIFDSAAYSKRLRPPGSNRYFVNLLSNISTHQVPAFDSR